MVGRWNWEVTAGSQEKNARALTNSSSIVVRTELLSGAETNFIGHLFCIRHYVKGFPHLIPLISQRVATV